MDEELEREQSKLTSGLLVVATEWGVAFLELGKMGQVGVEEAIVHFCPFEIEIPVSCTTEMSNKAVKEIGLKFWGEFGARVKFGDTSLGSRAGQEARMT